QNACWKKRAGSVNKQRVGNHVDTSATTQAISARGNLATTGDSQIAHLHGNASPVPGAKKIDSGNACWKKRAGSVNEKRVGNHINASGPARRTKVARGNLPSIDDFHIARVHENVSPVPATNCFSENARREAWSCRSVNDKQVGCQLDTSGIAVAK